MIELDIADLTHTVTLFVLTEDKDKIIKYSIFVRLMVTVIPFDLSPLHIEKLVHRQRPNSKLPVCVIAPQEDHDRV